jgi:hypothetical protein
VSASLQPTQRTYSGSWWLVAVIGFCLGVALVITALCLVAFAPSFQYPLVMTIAGIAVLLGAAIGIGRWQHSIRAGLILLVAAFVGLAASIVPPVRPVVQAAATWITFVGYKRELDREVVSQRRANAGTAVVKVTVFNMMLMAGGYAFDTSGHMAAHMGTPTEPDWSDELGVPCVEVSHLYGRYYAWHSEGCNQ